MAIIKKKYINREISWLSFNERVLQEASDDLNPLIERMKFLGIFSSNLDEFFRVRVGTLKRLVKAGSKARALIGDSPENILDEIQQIVINQQIQFDDIYANILKELKKEKIYIIDEKQLSPEQEKFVITYFQQKVRPTLFPVMIDNLSSFPVLKEESIYLAVQLFKKKSKSSPRHAIIEVPAGVISRFLVLPKTNDNTYIILLDDVIRVGLKDIFSMFNFDLFDAYTIKLTRDAELDIEDDITISFFEKISKSLKQRKKGAPVRFIYDSKIPDDFLNMLCKKNRLTTKDTHIPGGRYHNFKDFMNFPSVGSGSLRFKPLLALCHKDIDPNTSLMSTIRKKDILLHYPYQSFDYIIDILREASIDPKVVSIKVTLYRVAEHSNVINALINAARNGKSVTVVMELQARFDEEANIYWTDRLKDEGVKIIHGVPNLKVHSKLCLITRKERARLFYYTTIGTGNFNENTAKVYSDHCLLTVDKRLTDEVKKIFDFFEQNYKTSTYSHLLVAPFNIREKLSSMIKNEITNAKKGKEAYMILKMNSLVDKKMIDKLYRASNEGVKIDLIIRGICSLIPGIKGLSENIRVVSILDRFLEHSRIFVFCNGGNEQYYISSGDLMVRNLDRRIEVACPIYDKEIQAEFKDFLSAQLRDNTKAREINEHQDNSYIRETGKPQVRFQTDYYSYLKQKYIECRNK